MDTLCRYIGYKDFKAFCKALKESGAIVSTFFTSKTIEASSLKEGSRVLIGWSPNRLVELKFLGGTAFEVVSVQNAKLQVRDRFDASEFIMGAPLFIACLHRRDGSVTPPYVAAKADGLSVLEVLSEE